ncbi:MAG: trypsin-like peptidase domain-containing protein [Myxococcales bacterium]|nr:trypsin-like peptidase domain-containing protein [Myxococcales bacterium]
MSPVNVVLLLLAADGAIAAPPQSSGVQVFKVASPSVVVVMAKTPKGISQGSGVVVGPGVVVTNKHVVEASQGDIVVVQGERKWRAQVTARGKVDLAILELLVKVGESGPSAVRLRASETLEVGEAVFAIGTPRGLEKTLSEGIVSGLQVPLGKGFGVIQTTAAISQGSSGGGLFDKKGRLVAVTTAFLRESQQLNFAVSSDLVKLVVAQDPDVVELTTPTPPVELPSTDEEGPVPYSALPEALGAVECFNLDVWMSEAVKRYIIERSVRDWLTSTLENAGIPLRKAGIPRRTHCSATLSLTVSGFLSIEDTTLVYSTTLSVNQLVDFADGRQRHVTTWSSGFSGLVGTLNAFEGLKQANDRVVQKFRLERAESKAALAPPE